MGKAKAKAKKKTTGARAKRDRRRKLATEAPASAEELLASVPGLDALQVDEAQQTAFDDFCAHAEEPEQMQLGAVVRLDRGFPLVATANDTFRAEHAVGFAKSRGEDEVLLPAVGDRVAVRRAPGHDMGVIECVLPRRTSFERWRGRARGERQVLCSNVDSVLIVQALGAGEVQIWTDIDGMHNNDPRYVEGTFPIRRMNFDEAAELAYFGAKILHPSTIQPCKDRGIPVLLKNSMAPDAPGTVISDAEVGGHVYRAVAAKDGITAVRIYSARMLMAYGFLRRVFEVFEKYRTPIDMITTSEVAVSLTVDSDCRLPEIIAELSELGTVEVDTGNSIVCIVGRLDHAEHGRAREIMEAAGDVPLKMISYGASHRSIALLTDTRNRTRLLRNLNDKLFGKDAE